ncbi:MAG: outer membrane protein transport protein, partial [Pseudomonadota bacterium]
LSAGSAHATNGYFMIGYGAKSIGLAGSGVAAAEDRLVGALNPAGLSLVSDGFDVGLRILAGIRNGSIDCRGIFACNSIIRDRSSRTTFYVPNFGWKRTLSDELDFGITVYGNGGINTTYGRAFYREAIARIMGGSPGVPGFPRDGKIGIDFSQLFIAPTLAYKLSANHTIGLSPLISLQRFSTRGFELFSGISSDPTSLTGRGTDYNLGAGFRLGWQGQIHPKLRVGAQYTSTIWTGKAEKYNGLLADGGNFDAPPHWTIGIAWNVSPKLLFQVDYQRIYWESVDSIGNAGPTAAELAGIISPERRLGGKNSIGFGWIDQSVFKLGIKYRPTDHLTLRAGWNHGSSQIPNSETLINIIAPATVNDNVTLGGSWKLSAGEISVTYMHGFRSTISDESTNLFGAGARASIIQHTLDISWAKDF